MTRWRVKKFTYILRLENNQCWKSDPTDASIYIYTSRCVLALFQWSSKIHPASVAREDLNRLFAKWARPLDLHRRRTLKKLAFLLLSGSQIPVPSILQRKVCLKQNVKIFNIEKDNFHICLRTYDYLQIQKDKITAKNQKIYNFMIRYNLLSIQYL